MHFFATNKLIEPHNFLSMVNIYKYHQTAKVYTKYLICYTSYQKQHYSKSKQNS